LFYRAMLQFGTVKFFNEQKGYGFIEQRAGVEDVFMHIGEMADGMMPRKGDILNYDMGKNKKKPGKLMAVNVRGGSATQLAYGAAEYVGDSMDMRSMMHMMHMMMTMMFDKSKWSQFEEKLDKLEKGFQELRMLVEDVKETLRAPNTVEDTIEELKEEEEKQDGEKKYKKKGGETDEDREDSENEMRKIAKHGKWVPLLSHRSRAQGLLLRVKKQFSTENGEDDVKPVLEEDERGELRTTDGDDAITAYFPRVRRKGLSNGVEWVTKPNIDKLECLLGSDDDEDHADEGGRS
jgi:CspA family cold shock protein